MRPPLIKAVFHVHTTASADASLSPATLVRACLDHGIDVLAVTDHNTIGGAEVVARRAPFQVVVGEEIRTRERGEVIGLFLVESIPAGTPVRDTIRQIKDQGGLVVLPHPFDATRSPWTDGTILDAIAPDVDIVETFNARTRSARADAAAARYAARHGIVACAGADAHTALELARTFMELPPFTSPPELLTSLRHARRTVRRTPPLMRAAAPWRI